MRFLVPTSVLFALALGAMALACDDLNRPMAVPRSEPRHGCFSDVECPSNMKCWKGPQDVQGICEPRSAGEASTTPGDAGAATPSPSPARPANPPADGGAASGEVRL